MRAVLLDDAAEMKGDGPDDDLLALRCALARQCFLNEYVFVSSAEEWQQVRQLREVVAAALKKSAPVPAAWLAAIAAYRPLHELPDAEGLEKQSWPVPVAALLRQQIAEPRDHWQAAGTISVLTAIEDPISRLVREQYEQSPFPRWRAFAAVDVPRSFAATVQRSFPQAVVDFGAGPIDYLIAGCGTGRQIAGLAQISAIFASPPSISAG